VETGDGTFVRATRDRVAFDRKNAQSVNCCGEGVGSLTGELEPVRHEGVTYKFPFSTQKQTYQFWDVNSRRAFPAQYDSEEKIQGLTTYKFVQEIPTMELRKQPGVGSLVGENASFQAPVMYTNTRIVWVEPVSGVIVKGNEQARTTLRNSAGEDKITVIETNVTFNEETQKKQADLARDAISKINLVKWVIPLVGLVLGLAFGVVGLALLLRSRPSQPTYVDKADAVGPAGGAAVEAETERLPPSRRA
jgi:Porin PorA